ncbi:MAG: serine hydrolase domain-containing protein [Bryobacteraceae bacterium]
MTGTAIPAYASLDQVILTAMTNSAIPGASLAVTKDGRLISARGYGYADKASGALVQPDSLFRIASVSKVITAVAILHLVDEGKLRLDDRLVDVMNVQLPASADQRLNSITIRMLLQYSAGWDNTVAGLWEFTTGKIAAAMKVLPPPNPQTLFQYTLQQPLQFDPGTQAVYGNVGYLVLGRIIEKITGQNYEDYVRLNVLAKMGIHAMRIGRTFASSRLPGEVTYYDSAGAAMVNCVFPGVGLVPAPYGGETIEGIDSFGGWVASTIDLLRFWNGIEGRLGTIPLSTASLQSMTAQPSYAKGAGSWWGFGVMVQDAGTSWWKSGSFPGTEAYVVRFGSRWGDGFDWAVVFNGIPTQADLLPLWGMISGIIARPAANPPGDLFPSYISHDAGNAPTDEQCRRKRSNL